MKGSMKEQLDTIFQKEMDRKNFLKFGGGVILGLLGITGLIRLLLGASHTQLPTDQPKSGGGYGTSRYGE